MARNLTPSSTALLSLTEAVAGVAVDGQIVHGQAVPDASSVVKVHEYGLIVLPAVSFAPLTVAVYTVDSGEGARRA